MGAHARQYVPTPETTTHKTQDTHMTNELANKQRRERRSVYGLAALGGVAGADVGAAVEAAATTTVGAATGDETSGAAAGVLAPDVVRLPRRPRLFFLSAVSLSSSSLPFSLPSGSFLVMAARLARSVAVSLRNSWSPCAKPHSAP